jgi:hypothetical protein
MNVDPRHVPVEEARRALAGWLEDWEKTHALTDAEYLVLVSDAVTSRLWSHVRSERERGPRKKKAGK